MRVFSHSCSLYILLDHFLGVAAKAINTREKCGKQSTNSGERTIPRRKILPHAGRGTLVRTCILFQDSRLSAFLFFASRRVVAHQYTPCPPPKTIICGQQTSLHESEYGVPTASGAISRTAVRRSQHYRNTEGGEYKSSSAAETYSPQNISLVCVRAHGARRARYSFKSTLSCLCLMCV